MSIAIPFQRPGQLVRPAAAPGLPSSPPDPVFALMAATQMHAEGRLLAADRSGQDAKIASIPAAAQSTLRSQ